MLKGSNKIIALSEQFLGDVKGRIVDISGSENELMLFNNRADDYMESLLELLSSKKAKVKAKPKVKGKAKAKKVVVKKVKKSVTAKGASPKKAVKAKAVKAAKSEKVKKVNKPSSLSGSHILCKVAKHFGNVGSMSEKLGSSEANIFAIIRKDRAVSDALARKIEAATEGKFSYKRLTGKKKVG